MSYSPFPLLSQFSTAPGKQGQYREFNFSPKWNSVPRIQRKFIRFSISGTNFAYLFITANNGLAKSG